MKTDIKIIQKINLFDIIKNLSFENQIKIYSFLGKIINSAKNQKNTDRDRECLHCGTHYKYNHKKQKYCCNACRYGAWELKTGKKLHYKS